MAGEDLAFAADGLRLTIIVTKPVLDTFDAHRQRRCFSREAGGQLFAHVAGSTWTVINATGPRTGDRRGRFHFWPDRGSEQAEIYAHHDRGLEYVGDWHTHPEHLPTPSPDDRASMTSVVGESVHHFPGFLMCIVGRSAFPAGLWVSFHALSGAELELTSI